MDSSSITPHDPLVDVNHTELLLRRAQDGNRAALSELFERYRPRVMRIARVRIGSRLGSKIDPEDIVQETLEKAWMKLADFDARDASKFIDWLARIAENQIRDEVRKWGTQGRDIHKEVEMGELPLAAPISTPSQKLSVREQEAIYDRCLSELPEHYREVVLLRQYADMSWDQVAAQIGSPNAKAAVQLYSRAMSSLEEKLETHGFKVPTR